MGSLNTYLGIHPLQERARKLYTEGKLVVRFEMPFNVWCTNCDKHISKAVRFNAEKQKIGMYHSTPLWEFTMQCHLCGGEMVIRTDPKGNTYEMVRGIRRRVEEWTPSASDMMGHNATELYDDVHKEKLQTDMIYRLEQTRRDTLKAQQARSSLEVLMKDAESKSDEYAVSRLMRSNMRKRRKEEEKAINRYKQQVRETGFTLPLGKHDVMEEIEEIEEAALARAEGLGRRAEEIKKDSLQRLLVEDAVLAGQRQGHRMKSSTSSVASKGGNGSGGGVVLGLLGKVLSVKRNRENELTETSDQGQTQGVNGLDKVHVSEESVREEVCGKGDDLADQKPPKRFKNNERDDGQQNVSHGPISSSSNAAGTGNPAPSEVEPSPHTCNAPVICTDTNGTSGEGHKMNTNHVTNDGCPDKKDTNNTKVITTGVDTGLTSLDIYGSGTDEEG